MNKSKKILNELYPDEGLLDLFKKEKFKYRYYDTILGKYVYSEKKSKNIHDAKKEILDNLKSKRRNPVNFEIVPIENDFEQEQKVNTLYKAPSVKKKEVEQINRNISALRNKFA